MNKAILTDITITKLDSIFETETKYRKIMKDLWQTRQGLLTIIENRPDLKNQIAQQFDTLNHLIDAFLNHDLNHPIHEEASGASNCINESTYQLSDQF